MDLVEFISGGNYRGVQGRQRTSSSSLLRYTPCDREGFLLVG